MIMKLRKRASTVLLPSAPFNFDGTFHKPSNFEDGCNLWRHGSYWRAIRLDNRIFGIRIDDRGKLARPKLDVAIFSNGKVSDKDVDAIRGELTWRFNLDEDLSEFDKLMRSDKRFYPVFKKWRGMRNADSDVPLRAANDIHRAAERDDKEDRADDGCATRKVRHEG